VAHCLNKLNYTVRNGDRFLKIFLGHNVVVKNCTTENDASTTACLTSKATNSASKGKNESWTESLSQDSSKHSTRCRRKSQSGCHNTYTRSPLPNGTESCGTIQKFAAWTGYLATGHVSPVYLALPFTDFHVTTTFVILVRVHSIPITVTSSRL